MAIIAYDNYGAWRGDVITPAYGGTGVSNNDSSIITISGAFGLTLTLTAATSITLPTSGTLSTLTGSENLSNKTLTTPILASFYQANGGGLISVPVSAGADTVCLIAATQELDNKTLDAAVAKGTWTASGTWTIPAVTFGGAIAGGAQAFTNLGSLLIGSATTYNSGVFEVNNATNDSTRIVYNSWNNTDEGIIIAYNVSGSDTPGTYTLLSSGRTIAYIIGKGADGTDWQNAAYIKILSTGTVGDNRIPGLMEFHAYTDAASSVDTMVLSMTAAGITWNAAVPHTGLAIASAGQIEGLGTGANGFKLKNLKNAAASALSGTQLDVEIDIGGVPYHFTVYPTKA